MGDVLGIYEESFYQWRPESPITASLISLLAVPGVLFVLLSILCVWLLWHGIQEEICLANPGR